MRRLFLILSFICLAGPLIFPSFLRAEGEIIRVAKKEVKPEPFDLKAFPLGSRIMVALKNGSIFQGLLAKKAPEKIKLDLSYEKNGINGKVGLYLKQIASIKRLPHLSPLEEKVARLAHQKELKEMRERMAQRKATAAERSEQFKKAREQALVKAAQEKRQREEETLLRLLEKFPPEEGWGADRIERIHDNILLYDVFPSPEEQEFMQKLPLWLEALKILERKTAEEAKKAKEVEQAKEARETGEAEQARETAEAEETRETEEAEETKEVEETKGVGEIDSAP